MRPFSHFLASFRRALLARGARPAGDLDAIDSRRQFFRRASAAGAAAIGTGLLLPDTAWAAVEERADAFGITPGTVVDAQGRPVRRTLGAEPYIGEIMLVGWNFATRGWALCEGQLMALSQNTALFSLLGTSYGGDGRTTFGLPDLRGRSAIGWGQGPGLSDRRLGQRGGEETVTLNMLQMPAHNHAITPQAVNIPATNTATTLTDDPAGNILAGSSGRGGTRFANPSTANTVLGGSPTISGTTSMAGGSQSHNNMMPFLALNYQIALQGIFPSRS